MNKIKQKILSLALCLILVPMLAACGSDSASDASSSAVPPAAGSSVDAVPETEPTAALTGEIMIAAAASLQNAFENDLIPLFNETYPDINVTGTYDSSGKLQTQIEEGLDAQLFFSAATTQMDALVSGGFIDTETVVDLLENELVLIAGTDTETGVTGFENIGDAASVAIGEPTVPAGQYAEEVLTSLGTWEAVSAGASLGTNVTEVLNWVAEGSAEVGVVYKTDAANMPDRVRIIATAPAGTLKTPVVYPVGLTADIGDKAEAAQAFLDFLKSPESLAVFESYGFKIA